MLAWTLFVSQDFSEAGDNSSSKVSRDLEAEFWFQFLPLGESRPSTKLLSPDYNKELTSVLL